jgi:hypothetical protein
MEIPIDPASDACSVEDQFICYEWNQMAAKRKHRSKW